jgi:DNA repair exonuclease SbcCD ATPase subunit
MDNGLKELLENEILSEDTKAAFLEAWNNKLVEVKATLHKEVETEIREEFGRRYDQDKANLVEAMDNMLSDAVTKHARVTYKESKALKEQRIKLTKAIKETRAAYKSRVTNHTKTLETFVLSQLKPQLESLTASKIKVVKKLREHRTSLNEQAVKRINSLESFVIGQLKKEIAEFKQDKDSLVEMKVRMASEAKSKLEETRKSFVKRASTLVEKTVETHLRREMSQLKEDIRSARENIFGRRLFEAFQAEYMTSYLSEGTRVKKLSTSLALAETKLADATKKLSSSKTLMEQAQRRVTISEERAQRVKTLHEILRPLNRDKREVMENLLETVKTPNLKEAFRKYLPTVLNETVKDRQTGSRQVITEMKPETKRTVELTGNRPNRLAESAHQDDNQYQTAEIVELRRLAGIEK